MPSATIQPADAAPPGQNGLAELTLERRAGRTRLTRSRARPPLLVQQALYPDDAMPDMAYVFLANPTGGLLENDRQQISVTVGPGAKAHVTTQSATKIHPMTDGVAEQRVALNVADGGYLEYLPDPLIPYRDASLIQETVITVEPGAVLLFGDVIMPGRVAMGESFRYRRLSNRLTINRSSGPPIYREAFDLAPSAGGITGIGVLGPACRSDARNAATRAFGSMLIGCETRSARSILEQARRSLQSCREVRAGASLLPAASGVGVRLIGADGPAVRAAMHDVWSIARSALLGTAPPFLRKY